jgi:hypothetical protein
MGGMNTCVGATCTGNGYFLLKKCREGMFHYLLNGVFIGLDLPSTIITPIKCHLNKIPAHILLIIG